MIAHLFIDHGAPATRKVRIARVVTLNVLLLFLPGILLYELTQALRQHAWSAVPCVVVASELLRDETEDPPYSAQIKYRYNRHGLARIGSYGPSGTRTSDAAEADAIVRQFPVGASKECFVNPANDSESVIERLALAPRLSALGGSLAVYAGLWWWYCIPQLRAGAWKIKSADQKRRGEFFVGFCCAAVAVLWLSVAYVLPNIRDLRAMRWPAQRCEIISRNVSGNTVHGEVHVTLYSVDVLYRYQIAAVEYISNQFSFTEGSVPFSAEGKRALAITIGTDAPPVCYVNPGDPSDAVLTRRISPTVAVGLIPLALIVVGVWIMQKNRPPADGYERHVRKSRAIRGRPPTS
jgi:hypothetical protein